MLPFRSRVVTISNTPNGFQWFPVGSAWPGTRDIFLFPFYIIIAQSSSVRTQPLINTTLLTSMMAILAAINPHKCANQNINNLPIKMVYAIMDWAATSLLRLLSSDRLCGTFDPSSRADILENNLFARLRYRFTRIFQVIICTPSHS